jgi:shikimate kinase
MILKLKRTPGLYLVGFMASGKTTIGRRLADELGWDFADLDEDIVAAQGAAIVELFDSFGEEEFRKTEHAAMRKRVGQIERGKPMVVALGGGAFVSEVIQEFLIENGITIWLDCPFERVSTRIQGSSHRPLARDPEKF